MESVLTNFGTVLPGADVAVPAAETRARARSESAAGRTPPAALTGSLPWIEFSLPRPPSVNRFMGKLGNKSPIVRQWIRQADMRFIVSRQRFIPKIMNEFECELVFERGPHPYDLDNRIKPLMDWLQRVELIQNDRLCERLECRWGPLNSGVKVRLRPWVAS